MDYELVAAVRQRKSGGLKSVVPRAMPRRLGLFLIPRLELLGPLPTPLGLGWIQFAEVPTVVF